MTTITKQTLSYLHSLLTSCTVLYEKSQSTQIYIRIPSQTQKIIFMDYEFTEAEQEKPKQFDHNEIDHSLNQKNFNINHLTWPNLLMYTETTFQ